MSKILKNNSGSDITLSDTGSLTIIDGNQYTIDPIDYLRFARSSDVVTEVGAGNLVVNDGSFDFSISDGIDLIKGIFPNTVDINNINEIPDAFVPEQQILYKDRRLGQGGNPDNFSMDINGSSSDVDFYYEVPVGETNYWEYISIFVADSGSSDSGDFGSISGGLSDGLQLILRLSGIEYEIGNFKDNVGLTLCFSEHAALSAPPGEEGSGFYDESDYFLGTKRWPKPMKMEAGDRVIMRVRDNLTGLNEMGSVIRLYRVLP